MEASSSGQGYVLMQLSQTPASLMLARLPGTGSAGVVQNPKPEAVSTLGGTFANTITKLKSPKLDTFKWGTAFDI